MVITSRHEVRVLLMLSTSQNNYYCTNVVYARHGSRHRLTAQVQLGEQFQNMILETKCNQEKPLSYKYLCVCIQYREHFERTFLGGCNFAHYSTINKYIFITIFREMFVKNFKSDFKGGFKPN